MRCRITNTKKRRKLESIVGKPVIYAMTRGGTGHRIDIGCEDGTFYRLWPDGHLEQDTKAQWDSEKKVWYWKP